MIRALLLMASVVSCGVGYDLCSVEIPSQNMLVRTGGRSPADIVAVFPQATSLWKWDARLDNTTIVPYWRWRYSVTRNTGAFRYSVAFSIMGTPEEGLKYRDKSDANWSRVELEAWAHTVLQQFEQEHGGVLEVYAAPLTDRDEAEFKTRLSSWFDASPFSAEGIRIDDIVVNLPTLSAR